MRVCGNSSVCVCVFLIKFRAYVCTYLIARDFHYSDVVNEYRWHPRYARAIAARNVDVLWTIFWPWLFAVWNNFPLEKIQLELIEANFHIQIATKRRLLSQYNLPLEKKKKMNLKWFFFFN